MIDRPTALARQALRAIESSSDPEAALVEIMRRTLVEAEQEAPPRGLAKGRELTPKELGDAAGIDRGTARVRLLNACRLGHAIPAGGGRYRITTDAPGALRILAMRKHQGVCVTDAP